MQAVRPQVVIRDGHCRLYGMPFGECRGHSEWSHYNATHRRSKTRGMDPGQRHDRRHSMMLCTRHSQDYDQNRLDIRELTDEGCDGPLRVERDGVVLIEDR